jgi:hypothetical protein
VARVINGLGKLSKRSDWPVYPRSGHTMRTSDGGRNTDGTTTASASPPEDGNPNTRSGHFFLLRKRVPFVPFGKEVSASKRTKRTKRQTLSPRTRTRGPSHLPACNEAVARAGRPRPVVLPPRFCDSPSIQHIAQASPRADAAEPLPNALDGHDEGASPSRSSQQLN